MRVLSDRFHTRSPLNSEFTPGNEITALCTHNLQNMIKLHPCPAAELLQVVKTALFKSPAELSCACNKLVALSSNPHL